MSRLGDASPREWKVREPLLFQADIRSQSEGFLAGVLDLLLVT